MKTFFYSFLLLTILAFSMPLQAQSFYSDPDVVVAIENAVDQAFTGINKTARITVIHIQAQSSDLTTFITSELVHLLVKQGYNVVDRVDIDIIKYEQELQYSGDVDDNTAVSLGKFIGADLVVTGAVTSLGTLRRLSLKIIETETTIIKGTAAVTLSDSQQTIITSSRPQVNRVTVVPNTTTVNRGETQQYTAIISGTSNISQSVTWSVMGAMSRSTNISKDGLLSVATNETAPTLIVTVTSDADASKSETATVTIANDAPRVSRVDVYPVTTEVTKGRTQQFAATVSGTNNPSQAVTWTVVGGKSNGTGISTNGLLVVGLNETATALTVRATSTADRSKSGVATVTFPQPAPIVNNINIIPTATPIVKGNTRQFSATVVGINNPPQTVTWELSGATDSGTSINNNGLLRVASGEGTTALIVKAVSTFDNHKIGTATVAVIDETPSVTSVEVHPQVAEVVLGTPQQFSATVNGTNNPSQAVVWAVTGAESNITAITSSGVLLVAMNETARSLTVRATSVADASKTGTAAVTFSLIPATPTIANITISPSQATIAKGKSNQFTATVTGTNNPSQVVTWSLIGAGGRGTSISSSGLLQVATNETATTLLVTATSQADRTKSETATVTVTEDVPVITRVEVSPSTTQVIRGNTQQFSARVGGTNSPSQAVTWSVTGAANSGTGIGANGLLVVAQNETARSLTIRATSVADPLRSGTATVTLAEPPATIATATAPGFEPQTRPTATTRNMPVNLFIGMGFGSYETDSPGFEGEGLTTFNVGASMDIRLGKTFFIFEPGVRYVHNQLSYNVWVKDANDNINFVDANENYNYLNLSAKAKLDFAIGESFALQPFFGIDMSFRLSASGDDGDITNYCNSPMDAYLMGIDAVLFKRFVAGVGYDIGLANIWEDGYTEVSKNGIMFNVGYKF